MSSYVDNDSDSKENENKEELEETENDDDDDSDYYATIESIIQLTHEPFWISLIFILGSFSIYVNIYESTFGISMTDGLTFSSIDSFIAFVYLIDIIVYIGRKQISVVNISTENFQIPSWIIIMDTISLIPFYRIISIRNAIDVNSRLYHISKLNSILKLARIYYIIFEIEDMVGINRMKVILLSFFLNLFLIILFSCSLSYIIYCSRYHCFDQIAFEKTRFYLYQSIGKITGSGIIPVPDIVEWLFTFNLICLYTLFSLVCITAANISIERITRLNQRYNFLKNVEILKNKIKELHISSDIADRCLNYHHTLWKKREGHLKDLVDFANIPPAFQNEIGMDIYWFTFKHSSIFRNCELSFLRSVSQLVKSKIMLPGDILFENHRYKNRVVYIVSGVIQVLSEEDDETPILSFSAGTLLGECSLIFNYKSRVVVKCASFCNIYILKTKDFIRNSKNFLQEYRSIRKSLSRRIEDTKKFQKISEWFNISQENIKSDLFTIMWLKSTLHRLMIKDDESSLKHECQNVFLREEFNKARFEKKFFITNYLDTLAISERLELVTDAMFLKTSCPCILKPTAPILQFWKGLIMFVSILAAVIIPFYTFVEYSVPHWYINFMYIVTFFFWFDIYIQLSTAVITSRQIISNVGDIFTHRLGTSSFIIDIIAAVPFELYSCILLVTVNQHTISTLYTNRVLKILNFEKVFKHLEDSYDFAIISFAKYICIYLYLSYIMSCIFYSILGTTEKIVPGDSNLHSFLIVALHVILDLNNTAIETDLLGIVEQLVYNAFAIFAFFFYVFVHGEIAASLRMNRLRLLELLKTLHDITIIIDINGLNTSIKNRLLNYVETQWLFDRASRFLYNATIYRDLPDNLCNLLKECAYCEFFKKFPPFTNCSHEFLADFAVLTQEMVLPSNEIICYTNDVSMGFYFVEKGYCEAYSKISKVKSKTLGPGSCVGFVETLLNMPIVNTVVAKTNCRLLLVEYKDFTRLLIKYPEFDTLLKATIKIVKHDAIFLMYTNQATDENRILLQNDEVKQSFYKFGYNIKIDTPEDQNYKTPFKRLKIFSFLQHFLLRYTILPDSKFLYTWESIRCVCACLSTVIYSNIELATCIDCPTYFITILLDLMAWIDIYIQMHVCYYNEDNILIGHPLKTAKNYLTHSFLLDIIGVFPFQVFISSEPRVYNKTVFFIQLSRVFQLHRCMKFFTFVYAQSLTSVTIYVVLLYFMISICMEICVAAAFLMNIQCSLSENVENGIKCSMDSWVNNVKYSKPHTSFRVYLYSISFATHLFTRSGLWDFSVLSPSSAILVCIFLSISYFGSIHVMCKFISLMNVEDTSLLKYQDSITSITNFMKFKGVPRNIQLEVFSHFTLKWIRKRGKNINKLIANVHAPLKQDILFDMYCSVLENLSVFTLESKSFFCRLVQEVIHDVAVHDSCICKVNDVISDVVFIFKGKVKVFAPDGTHLDTLGPGSIIGNLDNVSAVRQTVNIITCGHIETLSINSLIFFKVLGGYPHLQKQFLRLTSLHTDYLLGRGQTVEDSKIFENSSRKFLKNPITYMYFKTFNPANKFIVAMKYFNVLLLSLVQVYFTVYQITIEEYTNSIVICQHILDIIYVIIIYIYYHTAYVNENGILVTDAHLVKKYHYRNKRRSYCQIISAIPIDLLTWILPQNISGKAHFVLSLNRLFRFNNTLRFCEKLKRQLYINLYVVRCVFILLVTCFILQLLTCSFFILGCIGNNSVVPSIECNFQEISSVQKLYLYLRYSSFIFTTFVNSYQTTVYPDSSLMIIFSCFTMIVVKLLRCLLFGHTYITFNMYLYRQNKYDLNIKNLQHFLNQEKVSTAIQERTYDFLKFNWKHYKGPAYPLLLEKTPFFLRELILNSAFSHHINNHVVFKKCHVDFNRQVVACLKNITYYKGNYVVFKGTINKCMYFVHNGFVSVISQDMYYRETEIAMLSPGSSFGIRQGLLHEKPHEFNFKCKSKAVILELHLDKWEQLMSFFPASAMTIKEQCSTYQETYLSDSLS